MKKIYELIIKLPSRSLCKWKTWQLVPFIIVMLLSITGLFRINIASDEEIKLPGNDPFTRLEKKYREYFPSADFIIVTLESDELFSTRTLEAVKRLTENLQKTPDIRSVISVSATSDLVVRGGTIENEPLMAAGYDPALIREKINAHPLFRHFLLSDDAKLFSIYLFPDNRSVIDNDGFIETIREVISAEKEFTVKTWGNRVIEYYLKKTIIKDFIFLGALALVIILAVQFLFTQSFKLGFLLFTASFLTTVITTALFPLFNLPLKASTIMIPVVVLALSTSYNIHLTRYYLLMENRDMTAALDHAAPVTLFTGGSTVLGFLTLLPSSITILRQFGFILVLGIICAMLVALFFLPPLILKLRLPYKKDTAAWAIPLLKKPWLFFPVVILTALFIFLSPGIGRISYDYRLGSLFMPRTAIYRDILYMNEHYKGFDELELVIDSGAEYGLVNVGLYQSIRRLVKALNQQEGVSRVVSFTTFADWLQEKLTQPGGNPLVESEESIGENLEIIFSGGTGLPIDMLIDMNYRYARLLIRFGTKITVPSRQAVKVYRNLKAAINTICKTELNGVSYALIGSTVQNEYVVEQLKSNQFVSIISFMAVFGMILLIRFKHLKTVLLIMLPGISNVIFFTGSMGWLAIPLSVNTLLAIAIVMGVSTDDAVYFMLLNQALQKQGVPDPLGRTMTLSGKAIVYTTLIIVLGISVLVLSGYQPVIQTGILVMSSLVLANLVTLFVMPGLFKYAAGTGKKPVNTTGGVI